MFPNSISQSQNSKCRANYKDPMLTSVQLKVHALTPLTANADIVRGPIFRIEHSFRRVDTPRQNSKPCKASWDQATGGGGGAIPAGALGQLLLSCNSAWGNGSRQLWNGAGGPLPPTSHPPRRTVEEILTGSAVRSATGSQLQGRERGVWRKRVCELSTDFFFSLI